MIFASFHLLVFSLLISCCRCVLPEVGEPICLAEAGPANLQHCNEIISNQMPSKKPDRNARYTFNHARRDCDMGLPAYLRRKNCLIVVNKLDNSLINTGSWETLRTQVSTLVDSCVMMDNGAGGHLRMANGLYIAVWKPSRYVAMALSTGGIIPVCMQGVRPDGPVWNPAVAQMLKRGNESSGTD